MYGIIWRSMRRQRQLMQWHCNKGKLRVNDEILIEDMQNGALKNY